MSKFDSSSSIKSISLVKASEEFNRGLVFVAGGVVFVGGGWLVFGCLSIGVDGVFGAGVARIFGFVGVDALLGNALLLPIAFCDDALAAVSFFVVLLIGNGIEDFLLKWLDEADAAVAQVVAREIVLQTNVSAAFVFRMCSFFLRLSVSSLGVVLDESGMFKCAFLAASVLTRFTLDVNALVGVEVPDESVEEVLSPLFGVLSVEKEACGDVALAFDDDRPLFSVALRPLSINRTSSKVHTDSHVVAL